MDWWAQYSEWSIYVALFVAWMLLRPVRDFYVLEWLYFRRVYKEPRRGELPDRGEQIGNSVCMGFDDYLAAKAKFDRSELDHMPRVNDEWKEAEQRLFVVSARTKAMAINGVKWKSGLFSLFTDQGTLLHKTPDLDIRRRREYARDGLREKVRE